MARFASMWDALFAEDDLDEWRRLREVLWGHCEAVGRDPAEIACSSHLAVGPEPDGDDLAVRAERLFEVGVDVVLFGLGAVHDAGTIDLIASALESRS